MAPGPRSPVVPPGPVLTLAPQGGSLRFVTRSSRLYWYLAFPLTRLERLDRDFLGELATPGGGLLQIGVSPVPLVDRPLELPTSSPGALVGRGALLPARLLELVPRRLLLCGLLLRWLLLGLLFPCGLLL